MQPPAGPRSQSRRDAFAAQSRELAVCVLFAAIVLYLAFNGGGYDLIVRNQVGLAVWWGVLVCAAVGAIRTEPLTRTGWAVVLTFAAFTAWTAVAAAHSQSHERSLAELSRVLCYLGVLVLAVAMHRRRDVAVRLTVGSLAVAIVIVACAALVSRLAPGTFPAANQTASWLPGARGRLGWPLYYWNALGALMALGLPLLLSCATGARAPMARALAAGSVPVVVLCAYLTFSRGGAIAAGAALLVYFSLASDRLPKLLTAAIVAAGSAVLVALAAARPALEDGLLGATARNQGHQLLVAVVMVAALTAAVHAGAGALLARRTRPSWLQVPPRRARRLLAVAVAAVLVVALAAGAPARISHTWQQFKRPTASALQTNSLARFGSTSGNQRYDYWKVAIKATPEHLLAGWGPGTFVLIWLPRAPYYSFVVNAHSLYIETLAEDGVIGLLLLLCFLGAALGSAGRLASRRRRRSRDYAAAVAASCSAFALSAAFDWVWQMPALVVAFISLVAAVQGVGRDSLRGGAKAAERRKHRTAALRATLVLVAIVSMVVIAIPLANVADVRNSQAAVIAGNTATALRDARAAAEIEPSSASAHLQIALVDELRGDLRGGVAAAQQSIANEPGNWAEWLVLSRLEAESGQPAAALQAYLRARSLNPNSPIFAGS